MLAVTVTWQLIWGTTNAASLAEMSATMPDDQDA
jgi:hypothetical protein